MGMMWAGIMSIFILFLAEESTTVLGLAFMASGATSTLFVFPSGFLADRWRRDIFIWIGGGLSCVGISILVISVNIEMVFIAQIVTGAGWGVAGTATEALIADSIPSGTRSKIYANLFFVRTGFSAVGPAISILLFIFMGDVWDLNVLRAVMGVAAATITLASFTTFFMADKHSLGRESESLHSDLNGPERSSFSIPLVIVMLGLIIGFGAGMTVAFFSPFFKDEYNMKPVLVNLVYLLTNLATGAAGIIGQRISKRLGLVETIFFLQMTAIYALAFIIQYPPIFLLIPLFITRNALMNASGPLGRTIVMDRIAKRHRGKWNALEQLAWGFFWSFSAVIGGWIIENYSYIVCFTITATVYMFATLPLLMLFGRVATEGTRPVPTISVKTETTTPDKTSSTPSGPVLER